MEFKVPPRQLRAKRKLATQALRLQRPRLPVPSRARQGGTMQSQKLFRTIQTLSADAGGEVDANWAVSPVATATNWATYSAIYDSYQVQKMKITHFPRMSDPPTGNQVGYLLSGIDRNSAQNPASAARILRLPGNRKHNMQNAKPFTMTWKILPEEKTTWYPIADAQIGCIMAWGSQGGNAVVQTNYIVEWTVLFKGRI